MLNNSAHTAIEAHLLCILWVVKWCEETGSRGGSHHHLFYTKNIKMGFGLYCFYMYQLTKELTITHGAFLQSITYTAVRWDEGIVCRLRPP